MTAVRLFGALFVTSMAVVAAQAPSPFGEDTWHHVVYENATMRLLSVNVAPGTMTDTHQHEFDIVTVSMNEGTETRTQAPGASWQSRPARPLGDASATEYTGKPGAHRVEHVGKRAYQLFAVENRKKSGWSTNPAITGIGTKVVQETRAFRIYDTRLALNTSQSSHTHTSPTVAILVSGKAMSPYRSPWALILPKCAAVWCSLRGSSTHPTRSASSTSSRARSQSGSCSPARARTPTRRA